MNFDHDLGLIDTGLQTLDVSTTPPAGGVAGVLTVAGTGAVTLTIGATADRPVSPVNGMIRYNTDLAVVESYQNNSWVSANGGTVSSVNVAGGTTGFTFTGGPITTSGTITMTGTLGAANGGTGLSSYGSANQVLGMNAGGTALEYKDVSAGTGISVVNTAGTITIANTGVTSVAATTTSTGLTIGGSPVTTTGTLTFTLSTSLQALASLGAGVGTGIVVQTGVGTFVDRTIVGTAGNTVVTNGSGVAGNPTIDLATVSQGSGSNFVKITLDGFGRVTGNTAVNSTDITTTLGYTPVNKAGDTMTGTLNMGNNQITNVASPTAGSDAANKNYVDAAVTGLSWKEVVRVATTVNGTLATAFANGQVVDGVTLITGDRILIKNQTNPTENGIYIVQASGAPVRATDADTGAELVGAAAFVAEGTVNTDTGWVQVTPTPITIGTSNIVFNQFTGSGTYTAGTGLTLTGNTFSLTSPVATTLGGTGQTTIGSANQFLAVNTTATALEYKTISASSGISVTPGAGTLSIANTGVLSAVAGTGISVSSATGNVTISNTGVTSVDVAGGTTGLTFSGGPVTTTGTITMSGTLAATNGGTGLTAYGTANQVLGMNAGATALEYKTVTAGTAISVVNAAGSITVNNTGVTSIAGTANQITASAATGAVTLSLPSSVSINTLTLTGATANSFLYSGAGGLVTSTAAPTNGQILIGSTGSAPVAATLTAGTGVSITNGAGSITINNTGVTSVALAAPSIFTVSGSPVTTTGTLTLSLQTQNANTVWAGPASGGASAPAFRGLVYADLPLKLYVESASSPTAPLATGTNSVAIGSGSDASGSGTLAVGDGTNASIFGSKAFANGAFATAGDAQHGIYVLRNITTTNTGTDLFLDGVTGTQRLVVPNNSVWTFDILVAARRTDATGGGSGYRFTGVLRKDATSASTVFVGTPSKVVLGETDAGWDAVVTANTTSGDLRVTVTGQNSKTVRWVATVQTTEVTN
jgi:hypothetical protein